MKPEFEYEFVRLGEQIFAPGLGARSLAKYLELIVERRIGRARESGGWS